MEFPCRGPEGYHQTSDYCHIGYVKNRPPPQINEIDDVMPSQDVQQVSSCATESHPKSNQGKGALESSAVAMQDSR
jgi:hypothetical protein